MSQPDLNRTLDFLFQNHPSTCRCDDCKRWWAHISDGGGPFTQDELDEERRKSSLHA
jgi:hypothetical protein